MTSGVNVRDLFFKALWTAIAAALTAGITVLADLPPEWWVPIGSAVVTALLALVRQLQGATPPTAPAIGPIGEALPDSLTGPAPTG